METLEQGTVRQVVVTQVLRETDKQFGLAAQPALSVVNISGYLDIYSNIHKVA